jgi:hypothetical protein
MPHRTCPLTPAPMRPLHRYLGESRDMIKMLTCRTVLSYNLFWILVLITKVAFDMYVVSHMVDITRMLWEQNAKGLYCWDYDRSSGFSGEMGCVLDNLPGRYAVLLDPNTTVATVYMPDGYRASLEAYRTFRAYYFRVILVMLRWSVPTLLSFSDILVFYVLWSTFFGVLYGVYESPSKVTTWAGLIKSLPNAVHRFNRRLISEDQIALHAGEDVAKAMVAASKKKQGEKHQRHFETESQKRAMYGLALSYEGVSLEWQFFARAWNAIVRSMRQRDMISNRERDEVRRRD